VRTLVVSVLALAALAAPALGLKLASDSPQSLPDSIGEKHVLARLNEAFPNHQAEQKVVVRADAGSAAEVTGALRTLARTSAAGGAFVKEAPRITRSADGTVTVLRLDAPFDAESSAARDGVKALRGGMVADAVHSIPGARWAVGGDTASSIDTDKHMADGLPWVIGFVVLFTMVVMAWVFRSVVIALVTAVVNLLSAGAAFGVLVLTFQHTWAESLLGFHSTGTVINWIPLFTFSVLFGLSMDYHVFVLSRVREAVRRGLSTRDAIREGIAGSAGTVTSAAIVMVSVFAIFASLHMIEMKELGIGLAVAVLVDAVVVRAIVLPSLMTLLGRWNWWPGRIDARAGDPAPAARELTRV
jgi:RND superfamily putative drug exporter